MAELPSEVRMDMIKRNVTVADIVRYHGSHTYRHGLYTVTSIDPGIGGYAGQDVYTLRSYPARGFDDDRFIYNVGRRSITPATLEEVRDAGRTDA
jgi:hypothetical protein